MTSSTPASSNPPTPSSTSSASILRQIGSTAWLPASHYGSSAFTAKVDQCLSEINYDCLLTLCSSLHYNLACILSPNHSVGTRAVVRKLTFSDGVEWVLRVLIDDSHAKTAQQMDDEVAIYRYLAKHTDIPVPRVHSYSADPLNVVGRTYMIFDYIHGSTISSLPSGTIEENREHLLGQMAHIQVSLASCTFSSIGSITESSPNEFTIQADFETGKGPFATSHDYYTAVADTRYFDYAYKLMDSPSLNHPTHNVEEIQARFLPLLFSSLIRTYPNSSGPFGLANMDLGFHNLLVNEELDVVGMIDCDYVFPAPKEMVARVPGYSDMEPRVPGMRIHTAEKESREMEDERLRLYVNFIREKEKKLGLYNVKLDNGGEEGVKDLSLAEVMVSEPARLVEGLTDFVHHNTVTMRKWMKSFQYMQVKWENGIECAREFDNVLWEERENEVQDNELGESLGDDIDGEGWRVGWVEEKEAKKEDEVPEWRHLCENGGWGDCEFQGSGW